MDETLPTISEPQPSHVCLHEYDLGSINSTVQNMNLKLDIIVSAIDGNGKPGLKTQSTLNKSHIAWLYAWVSGLTTLFVGAVWAFK